MSIVQFILGMLGFLVAAGGALIGYVVIFAQAKTNASATVEPAKNKEVNGELQNGDASRKPVTEPGVIRKDGESNTLRRRPSQTQGVFATEDKPQLDQPVASVERRNSFRITASPSVNGSSSSPIEARRSSLADPSIASPSLAIDSRRGSFLAQQVRSGSPSPTAPSSPKLAQIKKQHSGRGVTFSSEQTSPSLGPQATSLGLPGIIPFDDIPCKSDAVESACFSEEGYLAVGGGPEDGFVRIFNKGVGTIGSCRHSIDLIKDIGKQDSTAVLGFAQDEGKKSTLLLVGTRLERYLLAYKISKSASTAPLLIFAFETKHGSALDGVAGFIPKDATSYFDSGVYFVTCAKGTREVKCWSGKGSLLYSLDCDCWTKGVRMSSSGTHFSIVSSGAGPGCIVEVKSDKHHHLKFYKTKLPLPLDGTGSTPSVASPSLSSRRSAVGDMAFQAGQDFVFNEPGLGATLLTCRPDLAICIAHASSVDSSVSWEMETLLKPDVLQMAQPTHSVVLVPKADSRQTRVIISRGKHVFFFDASLGVIGVVEGRKEDGDVLHVALSPKADFAVIVAFGGSVARMVSIP